MAMEYDHHRVSPEGRAIGAQLVGLVEPVIKHLEAHGDSDERCKSCAFRAGTVPNGCLQTMMDAVKAMSEQKPFYCHVERYADGSNKLCAGWLATQWGAADHEPVACSWEFSPPDEPEPAAPDKQGQKEQSNG
ncbi:hypothetical protein [Comamonas testosteroni]|uniref:hypothetical protein n=1 Tax=Comamonas testosteroni TaxID=285 RepID=UPI000AEF081B|nr:hypothetical protein [Comamonas testosteroni]